MMETTLKSILIDSTSSDYSTRTNASTQLIDLEHDPATYYLCLSILADASNEVMLRHLAAIYFKNCMFKHYVEKNQSNVFSSDEQKSELRPMILSILSQDGLPQIFIPPLTSVVNLMISTDFPSKWPTLFDNIEDLLNSQVESQMFCGILVLSEMMHCFRWKITAETRAFHDHAIQRYFPKLLQIAKTRNSCDAVLWKILKVFKHAIGSELVPFLQVMQNCKAWVELFITIALSSSSASSESLDYSQWHKCQKWALFNINSLAVRYCMGREAYLSLSLYDSFAASFLSELAPDVCKAYLSILNETSERNQIYVLQFLTAACKQRQLWENIIFENINVILGCVFQNFRLTQETMELAISAPDEYLFEVQPDSEVSLTVGSATEDLLLVLSKNHQELIVPILEQISNLLASTQASSALSEDCRQQEACLHILSSLSDSVTRITSLNQDLKTLGLIKVLLENHVLNLFQSPNPAICGRCCQVVADYSSLPLDSSVWNRLVAGVFSAVQVEFPVTNVFALQALHKLIEFKAVHDHLSSGNIFEMILNKIWALMDSNIDLSLISLIVEDFIEMFPDQIARYSEKFCSTLVDLFIACDDEESSTRESVVNMLLTMVCTISNLDSSALRQLSVLLRPIFELVLTDADSPVYSDVLDIVEELITSGEEVSDSMVDVLDSFQVLCANESNYAIFDVVRILPCYVFYGDLAMLEPRLQWILKIVEAGISFTEVFVQTLQPLAASTGQLIMVKFALYSDSRILSFQIQSLVSSCLTNMKRDELTVPCLNFILTMIIYDSSTTLEALSINLSSIMQVWAQVLPLIHEDYILKIHVFALSKLSTITDPSMISIHSQILCKLQNGHQSSVQAIQFSLDEENEYLKLLLEEVDVFGLYSDTLKKLDRLHYDSLLQCLASPQKEYMMSFVS